MTVWTDRLSFILVLGIQACGGGSAMGIGGNSPSRGGQSTIQGGGSVSTTGRSRGGASAIGDTAATGGTSNGGGIGNSGVPANGGVATLAGTDTGGTKAVSGFTSIGGGSDGGGAAAGGSYAKGGTTSGSSGGTTAIRSATATGGRVALGGAGPAGGAVAKGGASTGVSTSTDCQPAFPGAEGFGRCSVGARGGSVYHVTNLNDSGAGSLRDAIGVANRTIVFDVSGVIELSSRLVFKSNLTVAGQTAPGGGIVVYGDGTSFSGANDTIVRYMRFRMGIGGESEKDAIAMANGHDVVWDHCSISWGRDGTFDLNQESGSALYNLTLQDSIVSQGLQTHSTGGLVVTSGTSIIRSLFIDNNSRNPKARGTTQFINNVLYNWVVSGYILGDTSGRSDGALLGNYFIPGPETNGGTLDSPTAAYHVYAVGNYYDSDKDGTLDGRLLAQGDFGTATWESSPSVSFPGVPVLTAQDAYQYVRDHAGASLYRDAVDTYVINELMSLGKQGKTISDEASLGLSNAVGAIPAGTTPKDSDQDGMPDTWETQNELDPNNANDRNGDRNGDGWTNLEEYVNSLAK